MRWVATYGEQRCISASWRFQEVWSSVFARRPLGIVCLLFVALLPAVLVLW